MHYIKNIDASIPLIRPRTSKVKARSEGQPGLSTVVVRGILSYTLSFSLPNTEFENRNYYQKLTESINTIYSHLLQNTSVSSSFAVLLIFTEKLKRRRKKNVVVGGRSAPWKRRWFWRREWPKRWKGQRFRLNRFKIIV